MMQERTKIWSSDDTYPIRLMRLVSGADPAVIPIEYLYRGDTRIPDLIHKEGFSSRGRNMDLFSHVYPKDGLYSLESGYVSTSLSKSYAQLVSRRYPSIEPYTYYVYEIAPQKNMVNVAKELKSMPAIPKKAFEMMMFEQEMAIPLKINHYDIKGVWVTKPDQVKETFIPNASYKKPFSALNAMKSAGHVMTGIGATLDAVSLYHAYQASEQSGNHHIFLRESSRIAGGWTSAAALGTQFALGGAAICGPVCGLAGGFVGSGIGYYAGSWVGEEGYDLLSNQSLGHSFIDDFSFVASAEAAGVPDKFKATAPESNGTGMCYPTLLTSVQAPIQQKETFMPGSFSAPHLHKEAKEYATSASSLSHDEDFARIHLMDHQANMIQNSLRDMPVVQQHYENYVTSALDLKSRTNAYFTFELQVNAYLSEQRDIQDVTRITDKSAHFLENVAQLTNNRALATFSRALASGSQAIKSFGAVKDTIGLFKANGLNGFSFESLLNSGTSILGAVSLIQSLFGDEQSDGLSEALAEIHSTIINMWKEMRESFQIVFNELNDIKHTLNDMERQNVWRFNVLMQVMDYYGTTTLAALSKLQHSLHGHMDRMEEKTLSYLDALTDEEAIKTINLLEKKGVDEIVSDINMLDEYETNIYHWLNHKATIKGYTGQIDLVGRQLKIENETLNRELIQIIQLMELSKGIPLSFFASLAKQLDSEIPAQLTAKIINTQDWHVMSHSYTTFLQTALPVIAMQHEIKQKKYQKNILETRQKPLDVLALLDYVYHHDPLWKTLIQNYLSAYQDIQEQISTILEEKRRAMNELSGIDPEWRLLNLDESLSENETRLATNVAKFLPPLGLDFQSIFDIKNGPKNNRLEKICLEQPSFKKQCKDVVHAPYYIVAQAFKIAELDVHDTQANIGHSFDVSCISGTVHYCSNTYLFQVKFKKSKYPFWSGTMYSDGNRTTIHGNALYYHQPGNLPFIHWRIDQGLRIGNAPVPQFNPRSEYSQTVINTIKQDIEQTILTPHRRRAAKELKTRIDLIPFENARLKLLAFIKLLNPEFSVDLNLAQQTIHQLLDRVEKSGDVKPLQQLLHSDFAMLLLSRDLKITSDDNHEMQMTAEALRIIRSKPLYQLPLFQQMATAYTSLDVLYQSSLLQSRWAQQLQHATQEQKIHDAQLQIEKHQQLYHEKIHTLIRAAKKAIVMAKVDPDLRDVLLHFAETIKAIPHNIDSFDESSFKPQQFGASLLQTHWENTSDKLGFSLEKTVQLIQKATRQLKHQALLKPAVLFVGRTKAGKSTITNACLGLDYKKEGRKAVLSNPNEIEYALTGKSYSSETLVPNFCTTDKIPFTIIDMPGFDDTRGQPEQIANGICLQLLQHQLKEIKGIVIYCNQDEVNPDFHFVSIRETLKSVGYMIQNTPPHIKQQLHLVVTRQTVSPQEVYDNLTEWFNMEYKDVSKLTPDQMAISHALSVLIDSPDHILAVDVTQKDSITPLMNRLHNMPVSELTGYSFELVSTVMTLIRVVSDLSLGAKEALENEIFILHSTLKAQLKADLLTCQAEKIESIYALRGQLIQMLSDDKTEENTLLNELIDTLDDIQQAHQEVQSAIDLLYSNLGQKPVLVTNQDDNLDSMLLEKYNELQNHGDFFDTMTQVIQWLDSKDQSTVHVDSPKKSPSDVDAKAVIRERRFQGTSFWDTKGKRPVDAQVEGLYEAKPFSVSL